MTVRLVIGAVVGTGTGVVKMPPISIGISCVVPETTVATVEMYGSTSRGLTELLWIVALELGEYEVEAGKVAELD